MLAAPLVTFTFRDPWLLVTSPPSTQLPTIRQTTPTWCSAVNPFKLKKSFPKIPTRLSPVWTHPCPALYSNPQQQHAFTESYKTKSENNQNIEKWFCVAADFMKRLINDIITSIWVVLNTQIIEWFQLNFIMLNPLV